MNRSIIKSEDNCKAKNSEGFKFALTTIVAFSTIVYTMYNYIQDNPLEIFTSVLVFSLLIPLSLIVLSLISSIITKGVMLQK